MPHKTIFSLHGNWNEGEIATTPKKVCPLCGYPMQLKYKKAYGLRLFICTNEPEICGFMTNDIRAGKLAIQKCDKCRDGYLIVKSGRDNSFFLGCTNYTNNGRGCSKMINKKSYYDQMGYPYETEKNEVVENKQPQMVKNIESIVGLKTMNVDLTNDYVEIKKGHILEIMYKEWNLNDVVYNVLKALQNISQVRYYGITMLVDVLRGSENKRIIDNGLNKFAEYGLYKEMPRKTIQGVVEWLIKEHFILKTKGNYPVLHMRYEGFHYSECITEDKLEKLKIYLEEELI